MKKSESEKSDEKKVLKKNNEIIIYWLEIFYNSDDRSNNRSFENDYSFFCIRWSKLKEDPEMIGIIWCEKYFIDEISFTLKMESIGGLNKKFRYEKYLKLKDELEKKLNEEKEIPFCPVKDRDILKKMIIYRKYKKIEISERTSNQLMEYYSILCEYVLTSVEERYATIYFKCFKTCRYCGREARRKKDKYLEKAGKHYSNVCSKLISMEKNYKKFLEEMIEYYIQGKCSKIQESGDVNSKVLELMMYKLVIINLYYSDDYSEIVDFWVQLVQYITYLKNYKCALKIYKKMKSVLIFKKQNPGYKVTKEEKYAFFLNMSNLYCENGKYKNALKNLRGLLKLFDDLDANDKKNYRTDHVFVVDKIANYLYCNNLKFDGYNSQKLWKIELKLIGGCGKKFFMVSGIKNGCRGQKGTNTCARCYVKIKLNNPKPVKQQMLDSIKVEDSKIDPINYDLMNLEKLSIDLNRKKEEIVEYMKVFLEKGQITEVINNFVNKKACKYCKTSISRLMICNQCRKVLYCTRKCQKNDWKEHKKVCRPENKV